ncbi:MAG: NUDIX hydrolase [Actinomycetota bacterium]|nr:NUDIX hydrolase [Actinomycetota bacterium]
MARVKSRDEVRAAGGVVLRAGADGELEVLLVHRPKYDDWTIPKGKLEEGETDLEAAVREVEEETGSRCDVGRELPSVSYDDRNGHHKTVRYWEMRPSGGQFAPTSEVDEAQWVPLSRASRLLTYDRDRTVLKAVDF